MEPGELDSPGANKQVVPLLQTKQLRERERCFDKKTLNQASMPRPVTS
jgi:hypothetical protein